MTRRIVRQADLDVFFREAGPSSVFENFVDRIEHNMAEHASAPFKAISDYDHYVEPTLHPHVWNPATADDPDDSAFGQENLKSFNQDNRSIDEIARAKRRHELGDMGRDLVEGLGHAFMGITGALAQARYVLLPHWDPNECVGILNDHDADMNHHNVTANLPTPAPTNLEEAIGQVGKDTEKFKVGLAVTPELMNQAKQGGFTLHDHVGDGPKNGYMVSLDKSSEHPVPMDQLTPQVVSNFVHKNTTKLQDPNAYLGGWLDKGKFYLDVSHHVPDLYHATKAGLANHQLGIYDLNHGRTIDTEEAGWMTGNPQVVGRKHDSAEVRGVAQGRSGGSRQHHAYGGGHGPAFGVRGDPNDGWGGYAHHPDHDWTQHRLGTDEDWGIARLGAAPALPNPPQAPPPEPPAPTEPPAWDALQNTGKGIGSHGGQVWTHPQTGEQWLVKPAPPGKDFLADADVAANHIAQLSGVPAKTTFKSTMPNGLTASVRPMFPAKDAFPGHQVPDPLQPNDLLELQKHHALDWLLGNHDSHPGQYIRDKLGQLIGIDKSQAFKYSNHDRPHWNTHINQYEPIHNIVLKRFATGGQELADPRQPGPLNTYVKGLQAIPDDHLAQILTPYAQGAAKAGELGKKYSHPHLHPAPKYVANSPDQFLGHMMERKKLLMEMLGHLHDKALAHRWTGTKVASANYVVLPSSYQKASVSTSFSRKQNGSVAERPGLAQQRIASVYTVNLKTNDGSVDESLPVDEWPQAVAKQHAHDLAAKHGLTLKEMARSPDDLGRLPLYMPAYRNDQYVGNAMIDRTENLHKEHNPFGPHADQYAYAVRIAAPTNMGLTPPALPSIPGLNLPKIPGLPGSTPSTSTTPSPTQPGVSQPKSPIPAGTEEPQNAMTPMSGQHPRVGPSFQWKSEHNGVPDDFAEDIQESKMLHGINPVTGVPYSSGGGAGGGMPSAAPGGGTPGMGTTPTGGPSAPSNYNPSGGAEQWRAHAEEALRRNNQPVTDATVNAVLHQIQTESSGNPKAQNNDDINAQQGHPSQGLLQTIPSTFNQYRLPGDSSEITDPQANLDAAINYSIHRYGPIGQGNGGIGSGHGY